MPLNHIEMSFQMGFIAKLVELNLKSYGHTYPFIVTVNKGKDLKVNVEGSNVLDTKLCRVRDGLLLVEEEPKADDIYINITMMRLRTDEDEASIPIKFNSIAKVYDPDAIAYVQSCLYNEYPDPDSVKRDTMLQDPENIHVIHICYYLKDDPIARISIMPFINKGVDKGSAPSFNKETLKEDEEHTIVMANCGWFTPYFRIDPLMQYPFKK